jgi:hypothetical protein
MTDTQKILEFLNSLPADKLRSPAEIPLETVGFRWSFRVEGIDKYGLLFSQLKLEAKGTPLIPMAKQVELITKLTYLQGGFKLVERDSNHATLSLRSVSPQQKDEKARYFEIVLKDGKALSLDHYEFDRRTSERRLSPANLSSETFARLIDDLQLILA